MSLFKTFTDWVNSTITTTGRVNSALPAHAAPYGSDIIPANRKNRAARRLAKFGNRIRCTRNHKFHAKRANGANAYNAATHANVSSKTWQRAALLQAFKPWGQYA